jgi:hypothetical protein
VSGDGGAVPIRPFIKPGDGVFDDHATRAMGEAFDAARTKIGGVGQIIFEAIAARIIAAAHKGERDPLRLCNAGLAGLGYDSEAS